MHLIPDGPGLERPHCLSRDRLIRAAGLRAPYDKTGCKNLIFAFKAIYFGDIHIE